MVSSCSAYGCTNRFVKGGDIKYHRFPTDVHYRKKWIIALKRKNFEPSRTALVCSNHFTDNDYEINVHGNKILKSDSIPSIFNFPQQCGKSLLKPRRVIERSSNSTTGDVPIDVNVEPDKQFSMLELPVGEVLSKASTSGNGQTKNISARKRKRTEPHYFGDFEEKDLENPSKRRRYWITSQKTVTLLREKVKYMQTKTTRIKNKIKTLQNLVEHLKNEK